MRWNRKQRKDVKAPHVDSFLNEVHEVCKKYGLCIEHEDTQGSFIIEAYVGEESFEWLWAAAVGNSATGIRPPQQGGGEDE